MRCRLPDVDAPGAAQRRRRAARERLAAGPRCCHPPRYTAGTGSGPCPQPRSPLISPCPLFTDALADAPTQRYFSVLRKRTYVLSPKFLLQEQGIVLSRLITCLIECLSDIIPFSLLCDPCCNTLLHCDESTCEHSPLTQWQCGRQVWCTGT